MASATTLVLVRHGRTDGNGAGLLVRMSGWTDLPLNEEGVRDAERAARSLSGEASFSSIYSSPLQRALRTALIIERAVRAELHVEPRLLEINCGTVDGLPIGLIQERYPFEWRANQEQEDAEFRWPGGESYREFRARVVDGLRDIATRHRGERVLVVTHAGVISELLGWMNGLSPARWEMFRPRNGSLSEVVWRGERPEVVRFDET